MWDVKFYYFDITPKELDDAEKKKGASLILLPLRNRIVNQSLQFALKSNPSPIYLKSFASRIETGNFDDDFHKIKDCDWVIEVIIERLDIKQQLFERVELHRKEGTLISSNTSGIPINMMLDGRSEDFQKHFVEHTFSILQDTCNCLRSSRHQKPIHRLLTSSWIMVLKFLERKPYCVRIRRLLLQIVWVYTPLWLYSMP